MLYHLFLSGNFYGPKIRHGIFRALNFVPGIFGGFIWSPRDFWGCSFLPPLEHPCHLKSGIPHPPPPWGDQHEISPRNINALKNGVVMRIEYMIRKDESNWYFSKNPHYFYWKSIGTVNENLNFDIRVSRVKSSMYSLILRRPRSFAIPFASSLSHLIYSVRSRVHDVRAPFSIWKANHNVRKKWSMEK